MCSVMEEFVKHTRAEIETIERESRLPHDKSMVVALREAVMAAKEGNFGIGAVLVDDDGQVVLSGHNKVFYPYFRSDLHAEMDVMTRYEENHTGNIDMKRMTLFSTLEPCPMCFTRLINSGIKKVCYAVDDPTGGMVKRAKHMPPAFIELYKGRDYRLANCSRQVKELALQLFKQTMELCNRKLAQRSG